MPPATEPEVIDRRESTSLARLDPQALIEKAIESGSGIETMERLVALAKDVRAVQAREAWYEAMAEFQRRCPPIKKTRSAKIQTARASYSYSYAPLDEILSTIQPVMGDLGLSVSWRGRVEADKVIQNCRISHVLGHHEESGDVPMPIVLGDDGRGANPMQRVGIATTYAKRYSLLSIIGMAPEDDEDGHTKGREGQHGGDAAGGRVEDQGGAGDTDRVITEPQLKRFHAIARSKWTDEQVHELLTAHQLNSSKEIKVRDYDRIVETVKGSYDEWKAKRA